MNRFTRFFKGLLRVMQHPRQWLVYTLSGTKFDYEEKVGDAQDSSVVMAPVMWIARNAIQARPELKRIDRDEPERIVNHDMLTLLRRPNPFYSGKMMKIAILISLCTNGNAYLIKIRAGRKVRELWYCPHFLVSPELRPGSGHGSYIDFYRYQPGGETIELDPSEVVHIRHGINPRNPRVGISPMYPAIREVYSDIESANFTGALLRNFGIPGVIISPENWDNQTSVQVDAKDVKEKYKQSFGSDRRGEPMVMTGPTKVDTFGFNPEQMSLSGIRNVSEERVCALLGVQPSVIGFGTGLQQTKVGATMVENRRASWQDGILPFLDIIADELTDQLLPDFEINPDPYEFCYNVSHIAALQESADRVWDRANRGVRSGWVRVDQAQQMVGLEPDHNQAVYLRTMNTMEVAASAAKGGYWPGFRSGRLLKAHTNGYPQLPAAKQKPPAGSAELMAQLARDQRPLEEKLQAAVSAVLDDLGVALEQSALQVLEQEKSAKQDPFENLREYETQAMVRAHEILQGVVILDYENELAEEFGKHYTRTAETTVNAVNAAMNVSVRLPDPVAREIVATGGRRAGLVDLPGSVLKRLFDELAEGQRLGLGAIQVARNVRDFVPAGPWSTKAIRAKVIARTETMHAQRVSALHTYRQIDPNARVMVFDGRLSTSCDECRALDGSVVTQAEAWALVDTEHPNGTRAFAVYIDN